MTERPISILAEFETYLDAYRDAILADERADGRDGADPDVDRAWERVNELGTAFRGRISNLAAHFATYPASVGKPCKNDAVREAIDNLMPYKYAADRLIVQYIRELETEVAESRSAPPLTGTPNE